MQDVFQRTKMLIGEDKFNILQGKTVAVFGLGGVGGFCADALARAGIGKLVVVDGDVFSLSNCNRQLFATTMTVGESKVDVAKRRIAEVSPTTTVICKKVFFSAETQGEFDFSSYDYVVDAIDTVSSKLLLAKICYDNGISEICCLGTGGKLHPELFEIDDVFNTSVCPLAKAMRSQLKKLGVGKLKVVYSREETSNNVIAENGRHAPSSISFVPPVAGYLLASAVVNDLLKG